MADSRFHLFAALIAGFAVAAMACHPDAGAQPRPATELVGLWEAKSRFGPDVRGRLVIHALGLPEQDPPIAWRATIAGRTAGVHVSGDTVSFSLRDRSGSFMGRLDPSTGKMTGHWMQPPTRLTGGEIATPLWFTSCGRNCFEADVIPVEDQYTFYLNVTRRPDGSLGAVLRNPERNLGRRMGPDRVEAKDSIVRWLDAQGKLINQGILRDSVMTVFIGNRGGSYDFRRVPDGVYSSFYPRGQPANPYSYKPPRDKGDGWPVGTLQEVGMAREKVSDLITELSDGSIDSIGALKVHGLLIARHGKLVLEEYFYGEHGDKPHDTRSASKTMTSIVMGAAAQRGVPIAPETPLWSTLRPGREAPDPRWRALRQEHLLTMSSGLDCDDNDDNSPGREEAIWENAPNWTDAVLNLKMIRDPGAEIVYCSAGVQLAGTVTSRIAGRSFLDLMRDLVAEPLGIKHYYLGLTAERSAVLGGGWYFRPRDFMKLGQLYLNGGVWQNRRIVSQAWVDRSTAVRYQYGRRLKYGYLWWILDYPIGKDTVQAYFASGLGGQAVMVFPKLDLVVAFYGGNYNDDEANWAMVVDLIPRYVLAAIKPSR